jgi:hypothetical protein
VFDRLTIDTEAKRLRHPERIRLGPQFFHGSQDLLPQLAAALLVGFAPAIDPYIGAVFRDSIYRLPN